MKGLKNNRRKRDSKIYFDYLDDVGRSGLVRMCSASCLLREEFPELSYREALQVLQDWISGFPRYY